MMVVAQYKLPSFWPLLSVLLQKGGFFPGKKVTNGETKEVTLQPWNGFNHLLVYILSSSSIFAFTTFGYYRLYSESNGTHGTVVDFLIEFYQVGSSLQNSPFDLKVLMTILALLGAWCYAFCNSCPIDPI